MFFRQFWLETRKETSSVLILNIHSCTSITTQEATFPQIRNITLTEVDTWMKSKGTDTHTHTFLWNHCSVSETADDSISDEGEQTGENI